MNDKRFSLYIDTVLNFIYPRNIYCILCGKSIEKTEKYSLCNACREKIKFIDDHSCEKCGKPLAELYFQSKCPDCIKTNHAYTKGFSCVEYDDYTKKLVHKLKYKNDRYLSYHMAEMMIEKLQKQGVEDIDLIIPTPLHKKKERKRGFNQAYLLAKYIGKAMNLKVDRKSLIKAKETQSQNQLSKDERKNNLKDAFYVVSKDAFKDKKILIIDDVYTTGSTMNACSEEILKAKPRGIFIMSFATGKNI
ncbi:ComF family protein [Marinisporobacter balticus]|uniref:ComF family protein n=1 Tax=Marinisporobacter balticus TaxID=2018667 RepID=A0A4R2KRZ1_9FIRM|nr:ComF family protein [Marinisporobacter balticus]TCO76474.1 ComF family protein [Marinisporobacter balticus]